MSDKLIEICETKRQKVSALKTSQTLAEMDRTAKAAPAPHDFAKALESKTAQGKAGLIAEIKKASPSAGLIRSDFDPPFLAQAYERGGAACLSVLTEELYFQGYNNHLIQARTACQLPILRKDFIVDVWQIPQSRAIGADCILLIMATLDNAQAHEFHAATLHYGMDVLIEVHDETELERALNLPSGMIGINNRNLKTLKTDMAVTERLAPLVPKDRALVSESGLSTPDDLRRMKEVGVHRFLIGESLMRQNDIETATKKLLGID